LDCFEPEAKADDQSLPRRQAIHNEAPRRPGLRVIRGRRQPRGFWQLPPVFGWSVFLAVFTSGILIGTMLARPVTRPTTPVKGSAVLPLVTVPLIPAPVPPVAVRDERGTAGSDVASEVDIAAGRDSAKVVDGQRPRAVVPALRGTLIVTSTPRGARVYVNNQLAGQTPLVMRDLAAGSRALRLDLDGYARWSRGVQVVADQSTTVAAQLARNQ
jgi:hypothetical protein